MSLFLQRFFFEIAFSAVALALTFKRFKAFSETCGASFAAYSKKGTQPFIMPDFLHASSRPCRLDV